MHCFYKDLYLF
ncbi:hypothetical protein CGLO_00633 [Colletotrichum gloeosporioides Cg-14]|uniref:Uncharacterized protein n=1 Tax=Colletotrichum gloeosporioides (strain Cg-14) TaxID=1237896 RepID=T0L2S7_COLGC|nr:hypothetical protein CGLO_00633 [Colletotrichum gloeosporioides Cg-14]